MLVSIAPNTVLSIEQVFSALVLLTFWTGEFSVGGRAVLCIGGC